MLPTALGTFSSKSTDRLEPSMGSWATRASPSPPSGTRTVPEMVRDHFFGDPVQLLGGPGGGVCEHDGGPYAQEAEPWHQVG